MPGTQLNRLFDPSLAASLPFHFVQGGEKKRVGGGETNLCTGLAPASDDSLILRKKKKKNESRAPEYDKGEGTGNVSSSHTEEPRRRQTGPINRDTGSL